MTDVELFELIRIGEQPGVEFKNARARQDPSFPEVVRAILAMANRRDGGVIVIGVDDNGNAPGLNGSQSASWATADHVRQSVAGYADPYVYLDVELITFAGGALAGRGFAVVTVKEFDQIPVLCAKSAFDANRNFVLQVGACYVRPSHMPATTQIANQAQLRDVLDLAIDKGVRTFVKRATAAGLVPGSPAPSDSDRFKAQRASIDE